MTGWLVFMRQALRTGGDVCFAATLAALFVWSTAAMYEWVFHALVLRFFAVTFRTAVIGAALCMITAWFFASVFGILSGGLRRAATPAKDGGVDSIRLWTGRICLGVLATFCFLPSFAQHSKLNLPDVSVERAEGRVYLDGVIGKPLPAVLRERLSDPQVKRLVVRSPGGATEAGFALAEIVAARPDLVVEVDGLCASACVLLFAASSTRCLDDGDVIGLHRGSEAGEPWSDADRDKYIKALEDAGADRAWVVARVATTTFYYADRHELAKIGFLNCKS